MIENKQHIDFTKFIELIANKLNLSRKEACHWLASTRLTLDQEIQTPVSLIILGDTDRLEKYIGGLGNGQEEERAEG